MSGYDPTQGNNGSGGYDNGNNNGGYNGNNNGGNNSGNNSGNSGNSGNNGDRAKPIVSAWEGTNQKTGNQYISLDFTGEGGFPKCRLFLNKSKSKKTPQHPDYYGWELLEAKSSGGGGNRQNNNNNNNNY